MLSPDEFGDIFLEDIKDNVTEEETGEKILESSIVHPSSRKSNQVCYFNDILHNYNFFHKMKCHEVSKGFIYLFIY